MSTNGVGSGAGAQVLPPERSLSKIQQEQFEAEREYAMKVFEEFQTKWGPVLPKDRCRFTAVRFPTFESAFGIDTRPWCLAYFLGKDKVIPTVYHSWEKSEDNLYSALKAVIDSVDLGYEYHRETALRHLGDLQADAYESGCEEVFMQKARALLKDALTKYKTEYGDEVSLESNRYLNLTSLLRGLDSKSELEPKGTEKGEQKE